MDNKLFSIIGKLHVQLTLIEEELARTRLELQSKEQELALVRGSNGHGEKDISDK